MASNDITGDAQRTKRLSPQGENNFEEIFGKRDWRNRPVQADRRDSAGTSERSIPELSSSTVQ